MYQLRSPLGWDTNYLSRINTKGIIASEELAQQVSGYGTYLHRAVVTKHELLHGFHNPIPFSPKLCIFLEG